MTKKNFDKVIIVTQYRDSDENERLLLNPPDNVLVISLNGYKTNVADCIAKADYDIRNTIKVNPNLPIITFRDYNKRYPDNVIDAREVKFYGSTLTSVVQLLAENNVKHVMLYMDNCGSGNYSKQYKRFNRKTINDISKENPKCNIYQIYYGFDAEVKSLEEFYGL